MGGTVLVPVDLSAASDGVVDQAAALARAMGAGAVLLHVEPPDPAFLGYAAGPQNVRDEVAHKVRQDDARLHSLRDRMHAAGVEVDCLLTQGPTVDKILSESDRLDATYIVVGSHGHGAFYDLVVGSVCDGVVRRATRPVVIVPRNTRS